MIQEIETIHWQEVPVIENAIIVLFYYRFEICHHEIKLHLISYACELHSVHQSKNPKIYA